MIRRVFVPLAVALMLTGCGVKDAKEITETRTVAPVKPAMPAMSPHASGMPQGHPAVTPYEWTVPQEWSEAPATSMRIGNFKLAASPETECYVSLLQGVAGGVAANINRWRGQMGQPELTDAEIEGLPKVTVLGIASPMSEITGSYTGMTGQKNDNYLLLAVVCTLPDQTLFVKMIGPESVVGAEKERFLAFCQSLKEKEAKSDGNDQENK